MQHMCRWLRRAGSMAALSEMCSETSTPTCAVRAGAFVTQMSHVGVVRPALRRSDPWVGRCSIRVSLAGQLGGTCRMTGGIWGGRTTWLEVQRRVPRTAWPRPAIQDMYRTRRRRLCLIPRASLCRHGTSRFGSCIKWWHRCSSKRRALRGCFRSNVGRPR